MLTKIPPIRQTFIFQDSNGRIVVKRSWLKWFTKSKWYKREFRQHYTKFCGAANTFRNHFNPLYGHGLSSVRFLSIKRWWR